MSEPNHAIEIVDIGWLKEYEANAKKHPDDEVAKLATSIEKFGWTAPIIVWKDGVIIAGHGRRKAALKLGLKKVPVIVRRDLTKTQADALRLADNRVAGTQYDQAAIQIELQRLADELDGSFELSDMGFTDKELDFALGDLDEISDDLFVDDISGAVETQKEENKAKVEAVDDTAAPVGDALGFKRVTIEESRKLKGLMAQIETRSGKSGVQALIHVLSAAVEDK
ncbi:ParB/Srx family N-terminal domain-containing protein (plasmid) [Rhizobium beringeri]|uniref:ParB/Srx family N-terminal domain-containing protein n=1 Tax=Rhizobium beringeri TaxID=3019934 RepID=UPI002DDD0CF0|nr:ParB/Srx family N-terminal domain-containing protein [Rhizobium beringeri]WSG93461.1 ParB/Srx family N-terminal domain-containing protein [Rhizobium beringeri]